MKKAHAPGLPDGLCLKAIGVVTNCFFDCIILQGAKDPGNSFQTKNVLSV